MSEKRRDHRGRILHNGEIQLSDGRYRFKYVDEMGKERCVYSWRLDHNDATPKGKRRTLSLREMEKKIEADHFEQIATNGGNMTVLELVEKYISTKTGVRPTTVAGYGTVINLFCPPEKRWPPPPASRSCSAPSGPGSACAPP